MEFVYLAAYLALPIAAFLRARSLAWTAIATAGSLSIVGVLLNFAIDHGHLWTRPQLQAVLLLALAIPFAATFWRRPRATTPLRHQLAATVLPAALLLAFFFVMTMFLTDQGAFSTPVGFLIGHLDAEDNAQWLDFTSQFAAGVPIDQAVALGGPLQLVITLVGTAMGVTSQILFGGYNEVAVAANGVVFSQFFMVVLAPLALAPLGEARLKIGNERSTIAAPLVWTGAIVLVAMNLVATGYGHLTFQYSILVMALWAATFLAEPPFPRARLITTLVIVASMTVWLPLNAFAVVLIFAIAGWIIVRGLRTRQWDVGSIVLWLLVVIGVFEPIRSSFAYLLGSATASTVVGGAVRGVVAAVHLPASVFAGLGDSGLFAAGGGTDQVGPIAAVMAAAAGLATVYVVSRQPTRRRFGAYARLLPIAMMAGYAAAVAMLDAWVTGGGPHYGTLKFTMMAAVVALGTCLPIALMLLDPGAGSRMSVLRYAGVGIVILLLSIDTLLPRGINAMRPQQWTPNLPFEVGQGYWWPAEVNGTGNQPIAKNPIACVYLPQTATAPSAHVAISGSNPQRIYACTRQLAALGGVQREAQAITEWLRREWLTDSEVWDEHYAVLAGMPEEVLDRQVILLDEMFRVVGLDSVRSLISRFPPDTAQE